LGKYFLTKEVKISSRTMLQVLVHLGGQNKVRTFSQDLGEEIENVKIPSYPIPAQLAMKGACPPAAQQSSQSVSDFVGAFEMSERP